MRSAIISLQSFPLTLVACSLSLIGCGSPDERTLEEIIEQSYKIEPTTSISIRNLDGSIQVYGSASNEMTLQATKRAYSTNRLKQIAINISVQQGSVTIETNFPEKSTWGLFDRSGTVDYIIVVPQTASISRLELANGEVSVEEVRGQNVDAGLGSGRMFLRNCFSSVDATVGRGTLTFAYEWWEPGKFSVQANIADGNVRAFLPSDAAFHLIAETVHGEIASDFAAEEQRPAEPATKIDMSVNSGGEVGIQMHATEGNIKIVEEAP